MDTRETTFQYGVDISKAYEDSNGDWIVEGVASSGIEDQEGENIDPSGLDYESYFMKKGFIKWEHGKDPKNFIGEPTYACIKDGNFFIRGKLYKHAPLAKQAIEAVQMLEKSNAKRRIGFSIEGAVIKRDPDKPKKILEAIIRNVVMTFNPVNDTTWAQLAKSLSSDSLIEIDLEKALSTASPSGEVMMPESLEQDEKSDAKLFKRALYKYLKALIGRKKRQDIGKSMNSDSDEYLGLGAFLDATEGFGDMQAEDFAEYLTKSVPARTLVRQIIGGELIMDELEKALDNSLDELIKSMGSDDDDIEKSIGATDVDENVEPESDEDEEEEDDEEAEEDEADDEDEEVEKSFADNFASSDDEVEKALEVSEFLEALVGSVGEYIDGFGESIEKSFSKQNTLTEIFTKSLVSMGELTKSLYASRVEDRELIKSLTSKVTELHSTVEAIANQPVGRRSVVDAREVSSLQKSFGAPTPKNGLGRAQIIDALVKSFELGEVDGMAITRFETDGYLSPAVREKLGL